MQHAAWMKLLTSVKKLSIASYFNPRGFTAWKPRVRPVRLMCCVCDPSNNRNQKGDAHPRLSVHGLPPEHSQSVSSKFTLCFMGYSSSRLLHKLSPLCASVRHRGAQLGAGSGVRLSVVWLFGQQTTNAQLKVIREKPVKLLGDAAVSQSVSQTGAQ